MYLRFAVLLSFFISLSGYILAQQPDARKKESGFAIEGVAVVATDLKKTYLSFGGPSLKFKFNPVITAALSAYPSLSIGNAIVEPKLGFGARFDIHKIVLALPMYYDAKKNVWSLAVGLGYRF